MASETPASARHIRLTSHPGQGAGTAPVIRWGEADAQRRGPVVGTTTSRSQRNVIGTHSGSYGVYRALAVAAGSLARGHRADLTNTSPTDLIGPYPSWGDAAKIVSIDPWGASVQQVFADQLAQGYDIRPTIAVTKAHIHLPEIKQAIAFQRLRADGRILLDDASAAVTKVAVEPVWWLPGVAERFKVSEADLRRALFEETGGMYPELVTRSDIEVFLPPIGGQTLYVFGDIRALADPAVTLTARVHDECNGSDVFGSDICTCRPYLTHAIEECIQGAQAGGVGLIAYSRKEGRALGEVTKFLVYNARKRQEGGDRADKYFLRTECVAGVQDMRFQELMPDVLHWLGIRRIHRLVSMSNDKYDAITGSGIEVGERVKIPDALVPADAKVEIEAKIAAGYFTDGLVPTEAQLADVKGVALSSGGEGGEAAGDADGAGRAERAEAAAGDHATGAGGDRVGGVGTGAGADGSDTASAAERHTSAAGTTGRAPSLATLDVLATLREPATIRARCAAITAAVADGRSGWFTLDRTRLDDAADRVAALTRRRFPDLRIPFHSRWRHFEAGGVDRRRELDAKLAPFGREDRLRAMVDLTVVSVLLDAGAGPRWRYVERLRGDVEGVAPEPAEATFTRSEGLGVASLRAFLKGAFSARDDEPTRADASALALFDATALRAMFQVSANNPMVGLEGRAGLLARLGEALAASARTDGGSARPCRVVERVTQDFARTEVSAAELLQALLRAFAPIWTSGTTVRGAPAGDVWPHRWAGAATAHGADPYTEGLVPFHKLSQWLTYSLLEPLQWAGVRVTGLDALTGLPEYRNGGLLIDCGVIVPRAPRDLEQARKPGDELVIEWRALTVTLLDELAQRVRDRLGRSADELPLACVLEGGTWAAGREIAVERRDGAPPLRIDSDGTVF